MTQAATYEKLGAFYLGRRIESPDGDPIAEDILYDSRDLTTHGVIVGMTGSGKTGLAVGMLEEAAMDGVPSIAIDLKGDLTNLLLTFPELRTEDFKPWIDSSAAARKGVSVDELAKSTAELWRSGLSSWGQEPGRIQRFRDSVDLALYTPGSTSGKPLSLLGDLDAPPPALRENLEAMRDRVMGTVSGLLTLLGIDADPVKSREHIFLSNLVDRAWREGKSLSLADLIRSVQSPPFETVGVIDLETFYPSRDRSELAMMLNNLLASPSFQTWRAGDALDIGKLLHTAEGRPRLSILYVAHLGEAERMFFVSRLLNEVVAWMRTQPGTESLRALLYMDEVFGYFPPTANPPSKRPLLTLMKQARAYGVGVLLATQNPVDLDYKGLSNAGTWMLGRLQTERDKARVLDGLETAAGGLNRKEIDGMLSALGKRRFLLHNVHEPGPTLFHTRWVMSYLAGPLTLAQVRELSPAEPVLAEAAAAAASDEPATESVVLPPDVPQVYLASTRYLAADADVVYRPALVGQARLHYVRASWDVDAWHETVMLGALDADDPWAGARALGEARLEEAPERQAPRGTVPASARRKAAFDAWGKELKNALYRDASLTLFKSKDVDMASEPGESESDFRARMLHAAREVRDAEADELRERYDRKMQTIQKRLRTAEERVAREESQYGQQRMNALLDVGTTLLGAFMGRKKLSRTTVTGASRAAKKFGRAADEKQQIEQAEERVENLQAEIAALEVELASEIDALKVRFDSGKMELEKLELSPRKSDIDITRVALAWTPWVREPDGMLVPAFSTSIP